jgi:hypothetical protein
MTKTHLAAFAIGSLLALASPAAGQELPRHSKIMQAWTCQGYAGHGYVFRPHEMDMGGMCR